MEFVEFNVKRLEYLMGLYGLSKDRLLSILSEGLKNPILERDIFRNTIKLSLLKKIDRIFEKGLSYYIDQSNPIESKNQSIFFRKESFNSALSLGARQIVNKFEENKLSFLTLSSLIDYKLERKVLVYKKDDQPQKVAKEIRKILYPDYTEKKKKYVDENKHFLNKFIEKLSEANILVFEFIETHNKKEKANIKGMFLAPNVIVLKKNSSSVKQEIFTLAHELGHYLLNNEEIDDTIAYRAQSYSSASSTEKWCSDFAYYFLVGDYGEIVDGLEIATSENDYHHKTVDYLSSVTQLSKSALYTRLLFNDVIAPGYYYRVIEEIDKKFQAGQLARKAELEEEKRKAEIQGRQIFMQSAKPINSPLYVDTLRGALYNGLITEKDFCQRLGVKPDKIEQYLV